LKHRHRCTTQRNDFLCMQWYVAQPDGSSTGPYDEEDLTCWIRQGHYPSTVLVWREGLAEWQQARSAIASLPPPLPASTPPPPQQTQQPQTQTPQPQPQPPSASFKQLWGQAWGQALEEQRAKHGKPVTTASPVASQAASSSQGTRRAKRSHSKFQSAMKLIFAISCAILLSLLSLVFTLSPVGTETANPSPPMSGSVVLLAAAISAVYGFVCYYFFTWISPMFMSFKDHLTTSPYEYFVMNVWQPVVATIVTGGLLIWIFRATGFGVVTP